MIKTLEKCLRSLPLRLLKANQDQIALGFYLYAEQNFEA